MSMRVGKISPLDSVAQRKITSSILILSLNHVIIGLLENALDARSKTIRVHLNYCRGFCSVQDDGDGIDKREFAADSHLAAPFGTSRSSLGLSSFYGHYGQFLAALAGTALVSIASKTKGEQERILLLDDHGRIGQSGNSSELEMMTAGTKVKVYNLFKNLPVRFQHFRDRFAHEGEVEREFAQLRRDIVALHLASAARTHILVEETTYGHKLRTKAMINGDVDSADVTCGHLRSVFAQAGLLQRRASDSWHDAHLTADGVAVRAAFASRPVPHKHVQFVALNQFPISQSDSPEIYALVNDLFEASRFAQRHVDGSDGEHEIRVSKGGQSTRVLRIRNRETCTTRILDRWPAFFIRIEIKQVLLANMNYPRFLHKNERLARRISGLLKSVVEEFLADQNWMDKAEKPGRMLPTMPRQPEKSEHLNQALIPGSASMDRMFLNHWSRVKTAHSDGPRHVLTGLPFMSKSVIMPARTIDVPAEAKDMMNLDPETSITTHDLIDTELPKMAATEVKSLPVYSEDEENVLEWQDARTGRKLLLNRMTGMTVVPETPSVVFSRENLRSSSTPSTRSNIKKSRKHVSKMVPSDLVAKINQYSQRTCGPEYDDQIPSIVAENHDDSENGAVLRLPDKSTRLRVQASAPATYKTREDSSVVLSPPICKHDLLSARVIAQVDRKFILACLPLALAERIAVSEPGPSSREVLVLIDQHAASERVGVEALFHSLRHDSPVILDTPLVFEIDLIEAQRLNDHAAWLAHWGLHYHVHLDMTNATAVDDLMKTKTTKLYVETLPAVIAERCHRHPKLVIDMLREEAWAEGKRKTDATSRCRAERRDNQCYTDHGCSSQPELPAAQIPLRLLDMINSRACRSAIMFNDELSIQQCEQLIRSLTECVLPFKCAHGRPSIHVMLDLADLHGSKPPRYASATSGGQKCSLNSLDVHKTFGDAWKSME